MNYTNSQKCGNTSVNEKSNPVRVLKVENGVAIFYFGIKFKSKQFAVFRVVMRSGFGFFKSEIQVF